MTTDRTDFNSGASARQKCIPMAHRTMESYPKLISVDIQTGDFDSLVTDLLIDLWYVCGEHGFDLHDPYGWALLCHLAKNGQRAKRPWPTICTLCGQALVDSDRANWYDLCPDCADLVSAYLDDHDLRGSNRRAEAIVRVREERCQSE